MTGSSEIAIRSWIKRVDTELVKLRDIDLGYPQGRNEITPRSAPFAADRFAAEVGVPVDSALCDFYRLCDGVTLSDVHVGYFIHPVQRVMKAMHDGEPTAVNGPLPMRIAVIGSDGGGGRFAVRTDGADEVVYLAAGAVHEQVFQGSSANVRVIAENFPALLDHIYQDLAAFVRDDDSWRYMV